MANKDIEKLVSVIIPARNIDYLLEFCIKKIRELYPNVCMVIVLDKEDEKQKEFGGNIKFLTSKNPNMSAKRNLGVRNTDTKYIAFIDSDAYPNENWLENAINFLENNGEYFAVTGQQFNAHDDNLEQKCLRLIRFSRLLTHKAWSILIDKNVKEQDYPHIITSNGVMRRDKFIEINGLDERIYLAEDNEFSHRVNRYGLKTRFIPDVSVFHKECTMYPFFRKIYCMCYYYANMFIKGQSVKTSKELFNQFLPIIAILIFIFTWTTLKYLNINANYLLILIIPILAVLIAETKNESKKIDRNHTKAFFIILFGFIIFGFVAIIGTICGFLNIPTKSINKCYKHY